MNKKVMNKKVMKKKKAAALISALCLAILITGCSGKSQKPSDSNGKPNSATESASGSKASSGKEIKVSDPNEFPIVTNPVTLTAWTGKREHISDPKTNTMITEYEKKTGVHIKWTFVPGEEYSTQLNLSFAGGEYPDMYLTNLTPEQVQTATESKILLPLNDLIESQGTNTKKVLEENPEYKEYLTSHDGNIYTLMETDVGVHMRNTHKMFLYNDWLQKLGGKVPETTGEFRDYLIQIRDKDLNGNGKKDEIPMISFGAEGDPVPYIMDSFQMTGDNYYYIDDSGKLVFAPITDDWKEGLRYLNDLYQEGLFYAEETYTQDGDSLKALVNKKKGEDFLVGAVPSFFQGRFIDTGVLNWTDYVPIGPLKGPSGHQAVPDNGIVFRLCSAISSQCKYPEVAMKWLDYWTGEEGTFDNVYGMKKGVNYEMVDEPAFSGADQSVKVLQNSYSDNFRFGENMVPKVDSEKIRYAVTDDESTYNTNNTFILMQAARMYESYYQSLNIPSIVWSDKETISKMTEDSGLFNDYIKRANTEFILGTRSLDKDWDAYLKELKDMGLKDYLTVLRKYYGAK